MKKKSLCLPVTALLLMASCGPNMHDAEAVIDKYCALNAKEHNAPAGPEKDAAAAEKKAYVKEVDDQYFKDSKTYTLMMDGMKKCDEALSNSTQTVATTNVTATEDDLLAMLPLAYSDAATVAKTYCTLTDQSIAAAKNGTDAYLKSIVAAKTMFEQNMEDSYKNNTERRDSIFSLIKPCMEKEVRFRHQNP
ncbi:hypothetical protein [Niabella hirudinis]|uniref:hypothetical protein n=1 Tax=Niabella hirudinis TaxID=1285929 RepID=UPI003EB8AA4D